MLILSGSSQQRNILFQRQDNIFNQVKTKTVNPVIHINQCVICEFSLIDLRYLDFYKQIDYVVK